MAPRKTLTWLAAVACLATACSATSAATKTTPTPSAPPSASTAPGGSKATEATEAQNKALVLRLYTDGFDKNRTDVLKQLLAPDYVQHDKSARGGPDGQAEEFQQLKAKFPGAVATVKHIAADGDLVAVHWQASATPRNEATGEARADLYRVADGRLAEHWGIGQTVPATTASGNSLFSDVYQPPKAAPALTERQEESNRVFAVEAYRRLSDGDAKVLDERWDPRYYQHNPAVGNGTAALKQVFGQGTQPTGGATTEFAQTLADGDLVWIFSLDHTVADIFRVADGKIIEHWDVAADGK